MYNEIISDIDRFEIELILYPQKILNRKVNLTYHYFIDKSGKEKILYYIDNKKMIITCRLDLNIETILAIIKQFLYVLEINKHNIDTDFYIVDKNKNKYKILFKPGRKYDVYGLLTVKSPSAIDISSENRDIITSTIEEIDLLKIYKIFKEIFNKKMFLDNKLDIKEIKKSISNYFKTGIWENKDIRTIIIMSYGKQKNIQIDDEVIKYSVKHFIRTNYKNKSNIEEILFVTDYGNCHISYEGFPDLIDYSLNYLQDFFGLTKRSLKQNRYPRFFVYNDKKYFLFHKKNRYITIKNSENLAIILHFNYRSKNDLVNRISFIRKLLENKNIILDLFNKENSNFIQFLMKILDRFSYKLNTILEIPF